MSYQIPLFDLNYNMEEEKAVLETLRSKWISMGPKCEELETMFAQMLQVPYAMAVTNCTAALHLACLALNIGEGDEVICPSLTFAATVNAIKYTGAAPVFCDVIDQKELNIDPVKIERAITPRTKAIIVMHYAGFPCKMNEILYVAQKYHLKVIEDACHGPLSEYKGKKIGTLGDVGCFSFFSNKNISTGEGGILVTRHEKLYERIKRLRSHGMTTMSYQRAKGHATEYDIDEIGYNYRFDDIRAALAIAQLGKLSDDLEQRCKIRELYVKRLKYIEDLDIPFENNKEFVSNYIMPLVLKDSNRKKRDAVRDYLHKHGIQTSVHYPAVHKFSVYQSLNYSLPITEYISDNEITIPMYSALDEMKIHYICDIIEEALKSFE